jgi:hypothetical protein
VEYTTQDKKERRSECGTARCSDQPWFDNRIAKERLHQGAANAKARTDEQAKYCARQTQLQKNALI